MKCMEENGKYCLNVVCKLVYVDSCMCMLSYYRLVI